MNLVGADFLDKAHEAQTKKSEIFLICMKKNM